MVKTEAEVETFIRQFMPKFNVWGIIFLNREKNIEALKMLGITPVAREEIIKTIEVKDYVETIEGSLQFGDLWVFGKDYDGTELYIKLAMGAPESRTICISFHVSEHPITFAFKD